MQPWIYPFLQKVNAALTSEKGDTWPLSYEIGTPLTNFPTLSDIQDLLRSCGLWETSRLQPYQNGFPQQAATLMTSRPHLVTGQTEQIFDTKKVQALLSSGGGLMIQDPGSAFEAIHMLEDFLSTELRAQVRSHLLYAEAPLTFPRAYDLRHLFLIPLSGAMEIHRFKGEQVPASPRFDPKVYQAGAVALQTSPLQATHPLSSTNLLATSPGQFLQFEFKEPGGLLVVGVDFPDRLQYLQEFFQSLKEDAEGAVRLLPLQGEKVFFEAMEAWVIEKFRAQFSLEDKPLATDPPSQLWKITPAFEAVEVSTLPKPIQKLRPWMLEAREMSELSLAKKIQELNLGVSTEDVILNLQAQQWIELISRTAKTVA